MKLITFISTGAFLFLSAFIIKQENKKQSSSLYDTKWSLKKIYTDTSMVDASNRAFIKFNAEKKTAGGNGSCNNFGSNFMIQNNEISFQNIFSTKMYCEAVQQTENVFFKQLGNVNSFEIKDKTLFLYQGKEVLLEFTSE